MLSRHGELGDVVTLSMGYAHAHANDSWTSLFARADAALQQAKGSGRNRIVAAAD